MNPAASAAPTGNHQVLATKKYVLINVISHMTTINARPIPQPSWARNDFPTAVCGKLTAPRSAASLPQAYEKVPSDFVQRTGHALHVIRYDNTPEEILTTHLRDPLWFSLYFSCQSGTRPGVHGAPAASISFSNLTRSTSTSA